MTTSQEYERMPEGLTFLPDGALQAKLAEFALAGPDKLHFVFDFDRTLTVAHLGTAEDITSWHILREHLPEAGKQVYQQLFEKYRALEIAGSMTETDAAVWWTSTLDLFVEYRLDLKAVEQDFLDRASIRSGATELFQLCQTHNIPTVIMSAGIRDVIDIWDKLYMINPSLVISTALELDAEGRIVGWHRDTLVHALNKAETSHPELSAIRGERPMAILVGDGMNDVDMASGDANVLRVRIFDPRPNEVVDIALERAKTFAKFDAMIENGSMVPLLELTRTIIG